MSTFHIICICCTIFLIIASRSDAKPSSSYSCPRDRPIRAAYYPSWNRDTFAPSSIDTSFFTHILYAFINPNNVTFKFQIDPKAEGPLLRNFTSTLRGKTPPVKTLFSIGGGGGGEVTKVLSRMASKRSSRAAFIASSINVAKTYDFDGFDLDWEFPTNVAEMKNLALLFKEWRKAVGDQFIITAAVYYSADTFLDGDRRAYPVDSIRKNVDWLNVMNYDYHGSWDNTTTGAHAALYDPKTNLSTNFGIGRWIRVGVPRCKLVIGIPMYGRTWRLKNTKSHGVGAPAVGPGPGEDATMTYAEIVKFNKENNVRGVFDPDSVSVYSYTEANKSWIGYDDPRSVAMKVSFGEALGVGGYMIWEVTGDYNWTISKRASDLILLLNRRSDDHSKTN